MKIAVTAASGQLGAAIIKTLIEQSSKSDVIALARTPKNELNSIEMLSTRPRKRV
jgi:NAD(P)H dehydrogenase (quinone)